MHVGCGYVSRNPKAMSLDGKRRIYGGFESLLKV